jgi:signal peptidase I
MKHSSSRYDFAIYVWWWCLIAFLTQSFIGFPFWARWDSMAPTINNQTILFIDKMTKNSISRGDIVVFHEPILDSYYIKRVVGLPWEIISIQDNQVSVCTNDKKSSCRVLWQSYIDTWVITSTDCGLTKFYALNGYIVLWDNREHSTDSRCCFVGKCDIDTSYRVLPEAIVGKVWTMIDDFSLPQIL